MTVAEILCESRTTVETDRFDAMEQAARVAGMLDADGYFTQSDDEFFDDLRN